MKAPTLSPCLRPFMAATALLLAAPCAQAATTTSVENSIGAAVSGQSLVMGLDGAPGLRFSITETMQVQNVEFTLTQSTGAFAVIFLRTHDGTPYPGSWLIIPENHMIVSPSSVVIFDPPELDGPTRVTIPYPLELEPGEYVLSFNILTETSSHHFAAYEPTPASEGVAWTPDRPEGSTLYGGVLWADTVLQPDIRINGTTVPEPAAAFLGPMLAALLAQRRKRTAP